MGVERNQVDRHSNKSNAILQPLFLQGAPFDRGHGKKCPPPRPLLLEPGDGSLGVSFSLDDDILHGRAQRNLHGGGILALHRNQAGHRPAHPRELAPLGRLHDLLDRIGEALKITLQLLEHLSTFQLGLRVEGKAVGLLFELLRLRSARVKAHCSSLFGVAAFLHPGGASSQILFERGALGFHALDFDLLRLLGLLDDSRAARDFLQ